MSAGLSRAGNAGAESQPACSAVTPPSCGRRGGAALSLQTHGRSPLRLYREARPGLLHGPQSPSGWQASCRPGNTSARILTRFLMNTHLAIPAHFLKIQPLPTAFLSTHLAGGREDTNAIEKAAPTFPTSLPWTPCPASSQNDNHKLS